MLEVLLSALLALLILAVVYFIFMKILTAFGAGEPIMTILQCIFIVIALIVLLRVFGVLGGAPYVIWR